MSSITNLISDMLEELPIDVMSLTPSEQRDLILENSRNDFSNLDIIWTQTGVDCCMAAASGWLYGFRSSDDLCLYGRKSGGRHYPVFIDNLYENYDHRLHLRTVKKYRPKYCTVRDVMTPTQCKEAGIKYYSPSQILEWGYQLKEYAQNVMIIPKDERYLKGIHPADFMIGYSVPSSYGGTPIPIKEFGDWRIHLLGGSVNKQIALWSEMPENVVSLDNNSLHLASTKGQFWTITGDMFALQELLIKGTAYTAENLGFTHFTNVQKVCIALSLGAVATYFKKEISGVFKDEETG